MPQKLNPYQKRRQSDRLITDDEYVEFFTEAMNRRGGDNFCDEIITDAAFQWGMLRDETKDYLFSMARQKSRRKIADRKRTAGDVTTEVKTGA